MCHYKDCSPKMYSRNLYSKGCTLPVSNGNSVIETPDVRLEQVYFHVIGDDSAAISHLVRREAWWIGKDAAHRQKKKHMLSSRHCGNYEDVSQKNKLGNKHAAGQPCFQRCASRVNASSCSTEAAFSMPLNYSLPIYTNYTRPSHPTETSFSRRRLPNSAAIRVFAGQQGTTRTYK